MFYCKLSFSSNVLSAVAGDGSSALVGCNCFICLMDSRIAFETPHTISLNY